MKTIARILSLSLGVVSFSAFAVCSTGAPLVWPVDNGQVVATHGCTKDSTRNLQCQSGIDIVFQKKTEIFSSCEGKIVYASGNRVAVNCSNGYQVSYTGATTLPQAGASVKQGQLLAYADIQNGKNPHIRTIVCEKGLDSEGICKTDSKSPLLGISPITILDTCNADLKNQTMLVEDFLTQVNTCGTNQKCNKRYKEIYPLQQAKPNTEKHICAGKNNNQCISDLLFAKINSIGNEDKYLISKKLNISVGSGGLVDGTCHKDIYYKTQLADFNHDGTPEVVVTEGNSCAYGPQGGVNHFFQKQGNDWIEILSGPGDALNDLQFFAEKNTKSEWDFIMPGSYGFCYSYFEYNKKTRKYELIKKVADGKSPNACK